MKQKKTEKNDDSKSDYIQSDPSFHFMFSFL